MIRKGTLRWICALMALGLVPGCGELLHNLQPHRLQRLNRHPPVGEGALYSVSDPLPTTASASSAGADGRGDRSATHQSPM